MFLCLDVYARTFCFLYVIVFVFLRLSIFVCVDAFLRTCVFVSDKKRVHVCQAKTKSKTRSLYSQNTSARQAKKMHKILKTRIVKKKIYLRTEVDISR